MTDPTQIEALASAATPGPWRINKYGSVGTGVFGTEQILVASAWADKPSDEPENLRYIAAANPAAILAPIERVRELEADAARFCIGDLSKVEGDGT